MKKVYLFALLLRTASTFAGMDHAAPFTGVEERQDYCLEVRGTAQDEATLSPSRRLARDTFASHGLFPDIFVYPYNSPCQGAQFHVALTATQAAIVRPHFQKLGVQFLGSDVPRLAAPPPLSDQWLFIEYQAKFKALSHAITHPTLLLSTTEQMEDLVAELKGEAGFRQGQFLSELKSEVQAYRSALALMAKASPLGLDEAIKDLRHQDELNERFFKKRRHVNDDKTLRLRIMSDLFTEIRRILGRDYFFAETYDVISYAAHVVLKELQDSPKMRLNELVLIMNHELNHETFTKLRRFRYSELSDNTKELLDYILHYEPYLDPTVSLAIWALKADAGFSDSKAPSPKAHESYFRLPGVTVMRPLEDDKDGQKFPHLPVGIPGLRPMGFVNLQKDVLYYEAWFQKHGIPLLSWRLVRPNSVDAILAQQRFRNTQDISFANCQGFFATK